LNGEGFDAAKNLIKSRHPKIASLSYKNLLAAVSSGLIENTGKCDIAMTTMPNIYLKMMIKGKAEEMMAMVLEAEQRSSEFLGPTLFQKLLAKKPVLCWDDFVVVFKHGLETRLRVENVQKKGHEMNQNECDTSLRNALLLHWVKEVCCFC
jgi:hypothetical protein